MEGRSACHGQAGLAVIVALLIGLIAGVLPALRAAQLDPVDAPLPPRLGARLGKYFPGLNLEAIRLQAGIPRYGRGRPG
ncbi:MAG: ABC transporter permease [Gammaproteobacteria bacterium]|nr:ABC transporter permease [Gammaproteobacteria bacterium]